jgi:uncharacterized repeat protein (TIGR03803 family)
MRDQRLFIGLTGILLAIFTATVSAASAQAATEKVIHSFNSADGGGFHTYSGVIFDGAGNLYGNTYNGGPDDAGNVFELTPTVGGGWAGKVLYDFAINSKAGIQPHVAPTLDADGNLYSVTGDAVFKLTPTAVGPWAEKVVHSFGNGTDGSFLAGSLIVDAADNLYGTTIYGGTSGNGIVFELSRTAGGGLAEEILHNFDGANGAGPSGALIFDAAGSLYGTTVAGGTGDGAGVAFELSPSAGGGWVYKVLHFFNGTDGENPVGSLVFDASGNLYGMSQAGGTSGCGTVFELSPEAGGGWTEKVLRSFGKAGKDGINPIAGLTIDAAGDLYGVSNLGGSVDGGIYSAGIAFELTPDTRGGWTEKILHQFGAYATDGQRPNGPLVFDAAGNLYGTTFYGGTGNGSPPVPGGGTVFEITP